MEKPHWNSHWVAAGYGFNTEQDPIANLISRVLQDGDKVPDRTGTGTLEMFGAGLSYDVRDQFPLCTLKYTNFKSILAETLWLISGEDRIDMMQELGANHWNPWLPKDQRFGENSLGRVYGVQWRDWNRPTSMLGGTDQLSMLVRGLKENPHGRRHLVTCWNPSELGEMALPPCHVMFQCHVNSRKEISLQVYQRSVDLFIGCPYDVGIYTLILYMLAHACNFKPRRLTLSFGSAHIYLNHLDQAREMISRTGHAFPRLGIEDNGQMHLDDYIFEDFTLIDYTSRPFIKAPVAV